MVATHVLRFLVVAAASLGIATGSAIATLPGGGQLKIEESAALAARDGEAADAGSRAAGSEQGQRILDMSKESESGAGSHGDERSEASSAVDIEEGEQVDGAFNAFVLKHNRDYQHGTDEYEMRKALFKQRLAAVHSHNAKSSRRWKAALSKFSDHTDAERAAMRGYRKGASQMQRGASMLQKSDNTTMKQLPESKSWQHLQVASDIRDQGSCGSCWAISTVSVLEAHYEIYSAAAGHHQKFSAQQTLECTPNPQECGGQGGCKGATVELGMDWILKNGIATEAEVPYLAEDGKCSVPEVLAGHTRSTSEPAGAAIGMMSYHTLESNSDFPLAEAVAHYGPVAVSASASNWFEYQGGVFDGCDQDCVVDHAITLYGYGKHQGAKYWLIKNSWGADWGENGYIRLLRHGTGEKFCGTDNDPSQGLGCKGGPASVEVCGMCGVLYDSVVPHFRGSPLHTSSGPSSLMRMEAKRI